MHEIHVIPNWILICYNFFVPCTKEKHPENKILLIFKAFPAEDAFNSNGYFTSHSAQVTNETKFDFCDKKSPWISQVVDYESFITFFIHSICNYLT